MSYVSLHDRLRGPIATALKKELGVDNVFALPRLKKVVVNVGINRTKMEGKELHEYIVQTLAAITGQKAVFRTTRKAISNFKTREGMTVGAMVTLRGRRMEEFLDRLLSYVLPRIRDFRGLPAKMDGHGNYAIGLRDHTIFPEVPPIEAGRIFGMQIQITTTAGKDIPARALLKAMGMPFEPERKVQAGKGKVASVVDSSASVSDTSA
ncbi:MAG: 50S ribosomal protein L5 [Candidatus Peribacteraceae bacterium]|jgi:large subunit ribosomal protein L5